MKNFFFITLVAGSGLLFACDQLEQLTEEDPLPGTIINYVIPSGEHYANQSSYQPVEAEAIRFRASFDSSAVYQTAQKENQADINKLYGVSDCNSAHHVNSARFGWRWYNNRLEILAYAYVNGERKHEYVTSVALDIVNTYEILFTDESYVFRVNDVEIKLPRGCEGDVNGYKLYPYFGGDETAPHQITIQVEEMAAQTDPSR